jgi:hypothetical protein
MLFPISGDPEADAFLTQIREGTERDAPAPRYEMVRTTLELSQARPYICAIYRATAIDHGKPPSLFSSKPKPLQFQVVTLYCKYPEKPGMGFAVSFSHRGVTPLTTIDEEADSFINGVQVTPLQPRASAPTKGSGEP